jgi:hypothetical protein
MNKDNNPEINNARPFIFLTRSGLDDWFGNEITFLSPGFSQLANFSPVFVSHCPYFCHSYHFVRTINLRLGDKSE